MNGDWPWRLLIALLLWLAAKGPVAACPGLDLRCYELTSCADARACFAAGNLSLDGDDDSIPCEALCSP